jgi:hypothetical protein
MKYTLGILVMLSSLTVHSQVCKFRVIEDCMIDNKADKVKIDWKKADFLIVINFDKSKIRLFVDTTLNYDLTKQIKVYTDEKGAQWGVYEGVDDDGIISKISIGIYKDDAENRNNPHKATLTIEYSNYTLIYRLRRND